MMMFQTIQILALAIVHVSALAHSAHDQIPLGGSSDWGKMHMAEEHNINTFDAGAFFSLHDYDSSGSWMVEDIRRTYGMKDESTKEISEERKQAGVNKILSLFDTNRDGEVSKEEFLAGYEKDVFMPDLGFGPGHHGDDEYEYEIHHFLKYHDENTKEEDLTHPEDIAHFKKHDELEDQELAQDILNTMTIIEANIPKKFRRN